MNFGGPFGLSPKRHCPPGTAPITPRGPCVPRNFTTPFGGPASGLWPSGSSKAAPIAPSECLRASVFSDCFKDCSGSISSSSPGPICGWTFSEVFGPLDGTVTFSTGSMSLETSSPTSLPAAGKSLSTSLVSVNNISGQYNFTEYPTTPGASTFYALAFNNFDISQVAVIALFGNGGVVFQLGDPNNASNYQGFWTPTQGSHKVSFSIDASGVPTLYVDDVLIPLTFTGMGASIGSFSAGDTVEIFSGSGSPTPTSAVIKNIFIALGQNGPAIVYCCP